MRRVGMSVMLCAALAAASGTGCGAQMARREQPPAVQAKPDGKPDAKPKTPPEPPAMKDVKRLLAAAAQNVLTLPEATERIALLTEVASRQSDAGDRKAEVATLHLLAVEIPKLADLHERVTNLMTLAESLASAGQGREAKATLRQAAESASQIADPPPPAPPKFPDKPAVLDNAPKTDTPELSAAARANAVPVNAGMRVVHNGANRGEDALELPPSRDETLRQIARQQALWYAFADALQTTSRIKDPAAHTAALHSIGYVQAFTRDADAALKTAQLTGDPADKPRSLLLVARAQAQKKQTLESVAAFRLALDAALALPGPEQCKSTLKMAVSILGEMQNIRLLNEVTEHLPDPALQDMARLETIQLLFAQAQSKEPGDAVAQAQALAEKIADAGKKVEAFAGVVMMKFLEGDAEGAKTLAAQTLSAAQAMPLLALADVLHTVKSEQAKEMLRGFALNYAEFTQAGTGSRPDMAQSLAMALLDINERKAALEVASNCYGSSERLQLYMYITRFAMQAKDQAVADEAMRRADAAMQEAMPDEVRSQNFQLMAYLCECVGDTKRAVAYIEKISKAQGKVAALTRYAAGIAEENPKTSQELLQKAIDLLPQITDPAEQITADMEIVRGLYTSKNTAKCKAVLTQMQSAALALKDGEQRDQWLPEVAGWRAMLGDEADALQTISQIKDAAVRERVLMNIANSCANAEKWDMVKRILQMLPDEAGRAALLQELQATDEEPDMEKLQHLLTLATSPKDRADLLTTLGLAQLTSSDRLAARKTLKEAQAQIALIADAQARCTAQIPLAQMLAGLDRKDEARTLLRQVSEAQGKELAPANVPKTNPKNPVAPNVNTDSDDDNSESDAAETLSGLAYQQNDIGDVQGALLTLRRIPDAAERRQAIRQFAAYRISSASDDHDFAWTERDTTPEERPFALLGAATALLQASRGGD